jgi:long-chain acyl-CoA synthetase
MLAFSEASLLVTEDDSDRTDLPTDKVPIRSLRSIFSNLNDSHPGTPTPEPFAEIKSDHPAIALFTSGTTAFPKGVMLTHKNVLAQQRAHQILWSLEPDIKVLSYLPWDHVFGSLFERFLALYSGGCLCLDDSRGKNIPRLLENFSIIQPEYFFSVPLVYDRIRDYLIRHPQWESRFFHPRLRFIFTASAPLSTETAAYFQKKNLPIVEGWGLTETSPSCTLTRPSLERLNGCVGIPIPGVEIKISQESEILVRGHNVMQGYFNAPQKTREVIDEEGWLKTGDLGEISPSGLQVHGRKDRIFKLANGRKVNPAAIENDIKGLCPWIHQIYVFGSGKRLCRGLIFVGSDHDRDSFKKVAEETFDFLNAFNENLENKSNRLERILLLQQSLSLENGEVTPSLKIRPQALEENYRDFIKMLDSEEVGYVQDGLWLQRLVEEGETV